MSKIIYKILAVCCVIIVMLSTAMIANAATGTKSATASNSSTMLFPVNNGGWTSVDIQEIYKENYSTANSGATQFPSREKTLYWKEIVSTQASIYNVVVAHFNSSGTAVKYFNSWTSKVHWVDGSKWTSGTLHSNSELRTYTNTAGYYGQMATTVSCSGSSVVYQPVVARINLKY